MNGKALGYIAIAIGIVVVGIFSIQVGQDSQRENEVFHITLAGPENYDNGVYSDLFEIKEGNYEYRFVPNGDSPKILTVSLDGKTANYFESFTLEGTPHETGISTYYTWDYSGNKRINIPERQEVKITIDPNGNLLGPVSVDIIRVD